MIVSCPYCGKDVDWSPQSRWRPFCSERCRMIDLGAWAKESYALPAQDQEMIEVETTLDNSESMP